MSCQIADLQHRRDAAYQEIVRRLVDIEDGTGRRTRYYFAALFIQVNAENRVYSSREVEMLWQRWLLEH